VLNFKGKNNLGICSSCVHAKYQLSSFNIVEAIKEKGQKLGMINKILAIFQPFLSS